MMEPEEDTYSSIFQALRHPIRRRILRMLMEKRLSYTEILNELGVDNGLLNYHLENLHDLLAKGEDEKYGLSEFGVLGLTVMDGVETPKDKIVYTKFVNPNNVQSIVVILLLVTSTLLNGYLAHSLIQQDNQMKEQVNQYEAVSDQLTELSKLYDDVFLSASDGQIMLVASYELKFVRVGIDRFNYAGPTSALFYSPTDNSTAELSLSIVYPDELVIPLVIQRGNALLKTDATIESGGISYAPIIWEYNASHSGVYKANLPSQGWYTLSMSGRIDIKQGGFYHPIIGSNIVDGTWVNVPADVELVFSIPNENKDIFVINEGFVSK